MAQFIVFDGLFNHIHRKPVVKGARMSAIEDGTFHYRMMFLENRAVMLLIDPNDGTIRDASVGACQYYGYSLSELTAMKISDINTLSKSEVAVEMRRAMEGPKNHFNFRHRLASGEIRDVEVYSNPISLGGQKFLFSVIHDITERTRIEEQYRLLFERTGTGMAVLEPDGTLSLVNRTFTQLAEADDSEIIGRSFLEGVAEMDRAQMQEYHLKRIRGEDVPDTYEFQFNSLKGRQGWALLNLTFFPDSGQTLVSVIDITERKRLETELRYLSNHDPLTGLYNRRALRKQLTEELHRADRYKHALSVFMLDIDYFKPINDTLGHQAGDKILSSLAKMLESSVRITDYASRYGGEEFVVLLPETSLTKATELAERLRIEIAEHSISIGDNKEHNITVSIGVSTYPEHGDSGEDLLNAADSAMYTAKAAGRNCVRMAKDII